MGGHPLNEAGIHSPGLRASPRLTREGALHENCLRFLLPRVLGSSPRMTMIGGWAGVNHGRSCGIATMPSLIELGERFHLTVDSLYPEREGEAPTEPRTVILVHHHRVGVAHRAKRDDDRPTPRDLGPGSPAWDRGHLARSARANTTPRPSRCEAHPPPRAKPSTVIPAEVALGGHSLERAGIHSPGPRASPQLARPDASHENCLR